MTDTRRTQHGLPPSRESIEDTLGVCIDRLDSRRRNLVRMFLSEVVSYYDPDVVSDFLELRRDPTMGSILQLAAAMSPEMREQLLFSAEELYSTEVQRH